MRHDSHIFQNNTESAELRTRTVMALTGVMMLAEIIAGTLFKSMALLADGWHMSTHMAAFLIAVIAYSLSRKNQHNRNFCFGTGKIGVLGGFTSSILLLAVSGVMIVESIHRLLNPVTIQFGEALVVAAIGLIVNFVCAVILKEKHGHSLEGHDGHHHDDDKNLKAAYIHVVADAFTSVTAIIALVVGLYWGIVWIDAVMGLTGSLVIVWWAIGLMKETVVILVDYTPASSDLRDEITRAFSSLEDTAINDLHIWQVSAGKFAAIISVEAKNPQTVDAYHSLVSMHEELVHVSIQVTTKPLGLQREDSGT